MIAAVCPRPPARLPAWLPAPSRRTLPRPARPHSGLPRFNPCSPRCVPCPTWLPRPAALPACLPAPQCCEGLPETGIADEATWVKLLGPGLKPKASRDKSSETFLVGMGLKLT